VTAALRRYAFTIVGIAVGVAGLVALGAMAERIVRFIEGGDRFVLGQISVAGRGMGMGAGFTGGGMLPARTLRRIAEVEGVSAVQAQVMLPLNPSTSQFMTLSQELLLGMDLSVEGVNRHYRTLPVQRGRFLRQGDRHVAVLGDTLATSRGLDVGGRITLEGQSYEVVGVLERMMTAPDRFVMVPIADAREQWVAKDSMLRTLLASGAAALSAADLNTGAAVGWRDGADPDEVARRIAAIEGVNVQLPSELSRQLRQSTAFFSALLGGIGALAFLIGGLSLANTIAAAVFERIRDFGVKRALGASDLQLGREVLSEALAVTLSGGMAGIGLAVLLGTVIDAWAGRTGQQLFYFSPRLLGGALVFSVLLGAASAAYATARIVRLSPAEAIRRGT
jgi:putative ABC transport system permease protein